MHIKLLEIDYVMHRTVIGCINHFNDYGFIICIVTQFLLGCKLRINDGREFGTMSGILGRDTIHGAGYEYCCAVEELWASAQ